MQLLVSAGTISKTSTSYIFTFLYIIFSELFQSDAKYLFQMGFSLAKFDSAYKQFCGANSSECGCEVGAQLTYGGRLLMYKELSIYEKCHPVIYFGSVPSKYPAFDTLYSFDFDGGDVNIVCIKFSKTITGVSVTQVNQHPDVCSLGGYCTTKHVWCLNPQFSTNDTQDVYIPPLHSVNSSLLDDYLWVHYTLACKPFYFGSYCDRRCQNYEFGQYRCTETGYSICEPNYYGPNCTTFCEEPPNGTYTCDIVTGVKVAIASQNKSQDDQNGSALDDSVTKMAFFILFVILAFVAVAAMVICLSIVLIRRRNRRNLASGSSNCISGQSVNPTSLFRKKGGRENTKHFKKLEGAEIIDSRGASDNNSSPIRALCPFSNGSKSGSSSSRPTGSHQPHVSDASKTETVDRKNSAAKKQRFPPLLKRQKSLLEVIKGDEIREVRRVEVPDNDKDRWIAAVTPWEYQDLPGEASHDSNNSKSVSFADEQPVSQMDLTNAMELDLPKHALDTISERLEDDLPVSSERDAAICQPGRHEEEYLLGNLRTDSTHSSHLDKLSDVEQEDLRVLINQDEAVGDAKGFRLDFVEKI